MHFHLGIFKMGHFDKVCFEQSQTKQYCSLVQSFVKCALLLHLKQYIFTFFCTGTTGTTSATVAGTTTGCTATSGSCCGGRTTAVAQAGFFRFCPGASATPAEEPAAASCGTDGRG